MLKKFLKYASSNVMGMLGLSCYILVDTYFVSVALGADGLTALNLAIPVYSFVHGLGLLLGMGGGTQYAILLGEKRQKDASALFARMVRVTLLVAIAILLLGAFGAGGIAKMMQADAQVFSMTKTYIQVIMLFAPGFMMNDMLNCFVRNDGAPGLAMTSMLVSSFSNVILDYVFMFPLKMGIFGAVLATGLASLCGVALLMTHVLKKGCRLQLPGEKASVRTALKTLPLGIPSLVGEVSSGVVMIVFNSLFLRLAGNTGVAAYGVIANLSLVVLAVYSGFAQGAQPLVSHAKGAGNTENMRRIFRYEVISVLLTSLVICAAIYVFPAEIAAVFNSEKNQPLQMMAETGLQLYFSGAAAAGFNIILSAFFAAAAWERPSQLVSILRGFALMIPMAFALSAAFGTTGVWLAFPATEAMVMLLGIALYRKYRCRL